MNPFRSAAVLRAALALAVGSASLMTGAPAVAVDGSNVTMSAPAAASASASASTSASASLTGSAASALPTETTATDVATGLHLTGSPVAPGGTMNVTASVTNRTAETLPAGRLVLSSGSTAITETGTLDAWIAADTNTITSGSDSSGTADPSAGEKAAARLPTAHEITSIDVGEIAPGASFTTEPIAVAADSLEQPGAYGVYPIRAAFTAGDASAESRDTFIFTPTAAPATVGVAVAVPITVPASADGLIPADLLETYTGPSGVLTRQLDGVRDRPVAIGIDPRIIASIRALGTSAPESAVTWLQRLETSTNETFALQYGDADPAAEAQVGLDTLAQPTSLLYALDPANFAGMTPAPAPVAPSTEPATSGSGDGAVPGDASATPEPTEQPNDATVPDLAQLLDWQYTDSGILWPADDTLVGSDLGVFDASGATETIVASSNTKLATSETAAASARVGSSPLLVSDAAASAEFRTATVTAVTPDQQQDALNDLSSRLAVLSSDGDANGHVVLLTLDRSVPPNSFRVGEAIGSLQSLPGTRVATLDDARAQPAVETTISDNAEDGERLTPLTQRWENEPRLAEFATVLNQPELLTGRERVELLALTAVGWQETPDSFLAAVEKHRAQSAKTLQSVQLATTTQITMISGQASLPFAVRNDLAYPITVRLDASASNPRLDIDGSVEKSVPAKSRETISVPVEARLGNGDVTVRLQLFSANGGVRVASDAFVPVVVRADWEGIGAIVLGSAVLLLFVGGLVRTILKRRAERRADAATDAETGDAAETASAATADTSSTTSTGETAEAAEATHTTDTTDTTDTTNDGPTR